MAAKRKINFTKQNIDAIPAAPAGKRLNIYDTQVRRLALSVTDKGAKTFIFRRKLNGRSERIFIGRWPEVDVEKARGKASDFTSAIFHGEDPADERRQDRQEMTLQEVFDKYLEDHSRPHKATWKEDESKFNQYLADNKDGINLAPRKVSTIAQADMAALHAKVGKKHKVTANHILILISSVFSRAKIWGLYEGENPCKGIPRFKQHERERFVQADEMPRLFAALAEEPNKLMRDFFLMALLTGARRGNVQTMRWADLTLTPDGGSTWTIPHTKPGRAQTVPLAKEAVKILLKRREAADEGDVYVFPSEGKAGYLREPKKSWARICKAAGITNLKIHDLRRTQGSYQAAAGVPLLTISKSLGDSDISVTQIYARLNLDPIREAMETSSKAIFKAGRKRVKPVVVKFHKKAAGR